MRMGMPDWSLAEEEKEEQEGEEETLQSYLELLWLPDWFPSSSSVE